MPFVTFSAIASMSRLDIYKNSAKMNGMKARSTVTKNLNLSTRVEKQRKGVGSYKRKNRYGRLED